MWSQTLGEVVALDAGHGRAHLGEATLVKELARLRSGGGAPTVTPGGASGTCRARR